MTIQALYLKSKSSAFVRGCCAEAVASCCLQTNPRISFPIGNTQIGFESSRIKAVFGLGLLCCEKQMETDSCDDETTCVSVYLNIKQISSSLK